MAETQLTYGLPKSSGAQEGARARTCRPLHRDRGHRPAGPARSGRDLVVAQAAGGQHPSGRDLPVRHGVGLRVLRRLPDRLRPLPAEHRGRPGRAVRPADRLRLHPLPAVRHRRDPEVLQLLPGHPDAGAAGHPGRRLGAARRAGRARLLRVHAQLGHPLRAHRGSAQRGPPLHLPGAPRRPAGHRLLDGRAGHPLRLDRPVALPPGVPRPRSRPGRDRGRGSSAGHPCRVRRRRLAPAAVVRPAADARRHPAGLRPDPAHHAAPVRPDVARADRARPGGRAPLRLLPARRGAGPVQPAGRLSATARPRRRSPVMVGPTGESLVEDPTMPVSGPGGFDARRQTPPPSGGTTWAGSGSRPRPPPGRRSSPPRSTTR